jgi:hypothetical protein
LCKQENKTMKPCRWFYVYLVITKKKLRIHKSKTLNIIKSSLLETVKFKKKMTKRRHFT